MNVTSIDICPDLSAEELISFMKTISGLDADGSWKVSVHRGNDDRGKNVVLAITVEPQPVDFPREEGIKQGQYGSIKAPLEVRAEMRKIVAKVL